LMTYREGIRLLDSQATAVPWGSDGELYGWRDHGALHPLGFAPHRPLDSRLIAVYRSGVMQLIDALDAIERMATRASGDPAAPAAISISQVLQILDAGEGGGTSFRGRLAELDRQTTPPPWDAGHLVLGMELDAEIRSSASPLQGPGTASSSRWSGPRCRARSKRLHLRRSASRCTATATDLCAAGGP
jgi:hypothetical protein